MKKAHVFRLLMVVLTILVGGIVLETGSCLYLRTDRERDKALRIFDRSEGGGVADIGIKKNFSQTWWHEDFSVRVVTNNIGLREDFDYNGERIDIGFLGDSFTFGHGVNAGERYSDRLREYFPDAYIVTFSYMNGWTTPHYYFFLKQNPRFRPAIAILGLFLGNDLTADIEETELVFDDAGELVNVVAFKQEVHPKGFFVTTDHNPFTNGLRRFSFGELLLRTKVLRKIGVVPDLAEIDTYPPIEFDRGRLNETAMVGLEYIRKIHELQSAESKRLVVLLIPWDFYVGDYVSYPSHETARDLRENQYLPRAILNWCEENGVECVDPIPYFKSLEEQGKRLYFPNDEHWNENGHAAAARVLHDYLATARP
ncbi:MAG: hypothetical protein GTN89_08840 [Acidobacteria bacterium]|nr:hypothetical protein [Acidobacteriota bacterium]NIM64147.1 hypothetical protein [Acidobacteriota bacterium]NIO59426.1 hypothetical protein [Acidobacteriota bacterium]NIQ30461.1 hypothetical protein [Acidobacteriota bacterium]NIQ85392.1 hypothetical protein [Acidobacteriota bacterium]